MVRMANYHACNEVCCSESDLGERIDNERGKNRSGGPRITGVRADTVADEDHQGRSEAAGDAATYTPHAARSVPAEASGEQTMFSHHVAARKSAPAGLDIPGNG